MEENDIKIAATADLHGQLPEVPECDLLLIAGDIAPDSEDQENWLKTSFNDWVESVPAEEIVVIAGNHDFAINRNPEIFSYSKCRYINNSSVSLFDNGLTIWGSPYVLPCWGAFQTSEKELEEIYSNIPEDTDIVMCHQPVFGSGDNLCPGIKHKDDRSSTRVGSTSLRKAVQANNFGWVVSGHIHEDFGRWRLRNKNNTDTFVSNVSHGEARNPLQLMSFSLKDKKFTALPFINHQ